MVRVVIEHHHFTRWRAVNVRLSAQNDRSGNDYPRLFFVDLIGFTRLFSEDCSRRLRITSRIGVAAIDRCHRRSAISPTLAPAHSPSAPHQIPTRQAHYPALMAPQTSDAVYLAPATAGQSATAWRFLMMRKPSSKMTMRNGFSSSVPKSIDMPTPMKTAPAANL